MMKFLIDNIFARNYTPLIDISNNFGLKFLYVKDECVQPTHTFKDRLAYEMLQPFFEFLGKEELFPTTFGSISYGNTAYSMGYFCKLLNEHFGRNIVNTCSFIPHSLKTKKFGPDTFGKYVEASKILRQISLNSKIFELNLDEKIFASSDLESIVRSSGYCLDNFIDVTEGLNRPSYQTIISEVIEHQLNLVPDYIVVPFGAGILCNEIMDYVSDKNLGSKIIPVSTGNPETIAVMLYGPTWVDTYSLLKNGSGLTKHTQIDRRGRLRKPYRVYHVHENEIFLALETLKDLKISAEPSSAAGFAILNRLTQIDMHFDPIYHSVLVINTGNGLLNFY